MTTYVRSTAALAALLLGACVRGRPADQAPAPVVVLPAAQATPAASPVPPATATTAGRRDGLSRQDVTRQAVGVFGDSVAADGEEPSGQGDAEEVTWDIDVRSYETHARVEHYVQLFGGSARERIADRLGRGTRYEGMIRSKFRAAGIPEDMYYLALIESGFDNNAYSRAAAVGMWQFMTTTAKGVGLRVDWWVDERRDPVRSTEGATRFLRALNEQLGSFYLAAAAYNGGPGRVSRGLTRFAGDLEGETGDDQFFALAETDYLPKETRNYVPQLIAAALVGKEPGRYGLEITPREPFAYDSVRVGPATALATVARATGASTAEVADLNPHVLRGMTPPEGSPTWVRVPVGRAAGFDTAFAALPAAERTAYHRVTSKAGQTKAAIAKAHGITVRQLEWFNRSLRLTRKGALQPGQVVLVPTPVALAAARDVPDPSIEIYGGVVRGGSAKYHVVKPGESLGLIAQRNGTTVDHVKRLNGLKKDVIFPGQQLLVSGSVPAKAATRTASARTTSKAKTPALSTKAKSPTAKKKPAAKSSTTKKATTKKATAAAKKSTTAKKATTAKKR